MQELAFTVNKHDQNHGDKEYGAYKNHVMPHRGNQMAPDNGSRNKAENRSKIEQRGFHVLSIMRMDICGNFLRTAPEISDTHGCGKGVPMQFPERLHLNATRQRRKTICHQVHILRHKRHAGQSMPKALRQDARMSRRIRRACRSMRTCSCRYSV